MTHLARQLESSTLFLRDRLAKIEAEYCPVWLRHEKITDARREWRAAHTAALRSGCKLSTVSLASPSEPYSR